MQHAIIQSKGLGLEQRITEVGIDTLALDGSTRPGERMQTLKVLSIMLDQPRKKLAAGWMDCTGQQCQGGAWDRPGNRSHIPGVWQPSGHRGASAHQQGAAWP
eukprot:659525-Amphidinium_carterae.1